MLFVSRRALSLSLVTQTIVGIMKFIMRTIIIILSCLTSHAPSSPLSFFLLIFPYIYHFPVPNSSHLLLLHLSLSLFVFSSNTFYSSMAVSGFEGFEKRLELHFSGDDPVIRMGGLRQLDFESIEQVLNAVQCTVVSAVGNQYFDSYVLSESSLFVYPTKMIIKTCGTTQLLKSILPLIQFSSELGFVMSECRYTRGNFIFPKAQPYPHTNFKDEIFYLQEQLPIHLCYRKASVMPSKFISHSWHVFTACDKFYEEPNNDLFTIEICMTELDRVLARKFFKHPNMGSNDMTEITGVSEINPNALICDFVFDPCGYSMNGIDGDRYSTIHVTPEDGFSYASYECVGSIYDDPNHIINILKKVVQVFRPGTMSISTTSTSNEGWTRIAKAVEPLGMKCRSCTMDDFPSAGSVVFQTFTSCWK